MGDGAGKRFRYYALLSSGFLVPNNVKGVSEPTATIPRESIMHKKRSQPEIE